MTGARYRDLAAALDSGPDLPPGPLAQPDPTTSALLALLARRHAAAWWNLRAAYWNLRVEAQRLQTEIAILRALAVRRRTEEAARAAAEPLQRAIHRRPGAHP